MKLSVLITIQFLLYSYLSLVLKTAKEQDVTLTTLCNRAKIQQCMGIYAHLGTRLAVKFILGSVLRPSLLSNRDWARLHICDQLSLSLDMLFVLKSVVAA